MTYSPKIYKKQGGEEQVYASGGFQTMESGSYQNYQAGSYFRFPVQALSKTETATNITNFGLSVLEGTSTGPTYTLAAPIIGLVKQLSLSASSSAAACQCKVNSNTTGVSFDTTGGNQLTLTTSALRGVTLVAQTTAKWRISGVYTGASIAAARTT